MRKVLIFGIVTILFICSFAFGVSAGLPSVSAKCAILIDASNGNIIFSKNADNTMPMASTTKIMTAVVAIENCDISKVVSVSKAAVGVEGSSVYLYADEKLTMESLLYAMMLESANDAAAAIAIEIAGSIDDFAALMNLKAEEIGLSNTHFTNPHGLDNEQHYTTAYDLAMLTKYALQNPIFAKIVSTQKITIPMDKTDSVRLLINHNRLLRVYDDVIGVKTGYTKKSGRCLVSAASRDGITLIAVTLNAPNDWNDHKSMLNYGFDKYENVLVEAKNGISVDIPVVGGIKSFLTVSNLEELKLTLERERGSITKIIEASPFLYAGIEKGDTVGYAKYYCDGELIATLPLVAQESIAIKRKPTFWEKIFALFS